MLYSALKASTPMTLTAITAYSRLRTSGSSGSGGGPAEAGVFAKANATRALAPIGVTTATSNDQKDDRTERNLIHSEATRSSARTASEGAGVPADRAAGVPVAVTGVSWLIVGCRSFTAVVDALPGEVQVGVLQRGLPGHQGVQGDATGGGQVPDGGGIQAGDDQRAIVLPGDGRAVGGDEPGEFGRLRRAQQHVPAAAGLDQSSSARVGEQLAAPDDDQAVGGQRHLAHQVTGDQDRAALRGQFR